MAPYKDKPLVELLARFPLGLAVHAGCAEFCGAGGRGGPAPQRRCRRGSGARPEPARLRCSPGPSRAGALGPAVGVRGCAEGGAALGGRCGFISAAGRDARRRQGAASNRRRRGPAAPSPAQPNPPGCRRGPAEAGAGGERGRRGSGADSEEAAGGGRARRAAGRRLVMVLLPLWVAAAALLGLRAAAGRQVSGCGAASRALPSPAGRRRAGGRRRAPALRSPPGLCPHPGVPPAAPARRGRWGALPARSVPSLVPSAAFPFLRRAQRAPRLSGSQLGAEHPQRCREQLVPCSLELRGQLAEPRAHAEPRPCCWLSHSPGKAPKEKCQHACPAAPQDLSPAMTLKSFFGHQTYLAAQ